MIELLQHTVARTRDLVSTFDPSHLSGPEARAAVEAFAELEKLAAAGKTLATGRLSESGIGPGDDTFRDPGVVARRALGYFGRRHEGSPRGRAASRQVAGHPCWALRAGALSSTQAAAVSAAAKADPSSEAALLEKAKTSGLRGLKAECDRVTAAAATRDGEAENYERIRSNRALRHRIGPDGTGHITINGPADRTTQIMAGLEPLERELFEQNRRAKNVEHPDAVAFDAMVGARRTVHEGSDR